MTRLRRFGSARAAALSALIGLIAVTAALTTRPGPAAAASNPPQAVTWGASGAATTLVLYDTTGPYGWLGELYAMGAGNLATHFGTVTAEPVIDYVPGQVNDYTATIYLGSTYNEPIPTSFLNDVLSTTHQVIWLGDNIWQLSGAAGTSSDTAFQAAYGWDPATSYFDSADTIATVTYNGQQLSRSTRNGPVLAPHLTTPAAVTVLGAANCTDSSGAAVACNSIAQTTGTSFPWAISSVNLTYVGEIPLSYMTESDRYLAFSDILFNALEPSAPSVHQALVRLEDVSPGLDTPQELEADADYLYSQHIPFSVGVIPEYLDPNGFYNNGIAVNENIAQTSNATIKAFDAALQYMQARGGTIIEHGDTHQYSNVANPYDAVSGDDFEFYQSWCSTTQGGPPDATSPCPNTDYVVEGGPLPNDSAAWAQGRAARGQSLFAPAGLPTPAIWETPHYAGSAADYAGIDQAFSTRYERGTYYGGQLTGGSIDYSHPFGQFFPYVVHDLDGATIIPEDLGNYEPTMANNNPPRPPSVIIANAQAELAVRQGVASFFFHPYYDVSYLQQIVQGIQALGYTFVPATSLTGQNPYLPVAITSTSLPTAVAGQAFSAILAAADGTAPYKWSIATGSLPAGLRLNSATGAISGTPRAAGTSTVTITATDSTVTPTVGSTAGSTVLTLTPGQASSTFTLTVNAPLAVTSSVPPAGTVGQRYAASLAATGGVAPYTWAVTSGSLPAGLNLDPNSGAVTGTPTAAGTSPVGITVTDSSSPTPAAANTTFTFTIRPVAVAIAPGSLPSGTVGQSYSAPVTATGGTTPYSWSATGLPNGLTIGAASGIVSGTPTRAGTFSVSVKIADSSKPVEKANATLTLTVNAPLGGTSSVPPAGTVNPVPVAITTASLPSGTVGQSYSAPMTATGGTPPYSWSATGLPRGLTIDPVSGIVSGTPSRAGTYSVRVETTDASMPVQTASTPFQVVISS